VLVVDDDAAVREAMHATLAGWGCVVTTAASAEEALARAAEGPPSVALCDLGLAGGDCGLALLEQLEALVGPSMRGVVMTGAAMPDRLDAIRATGRPLVFKPLGAARLRALVQGLAGRG
jgi:CheY-like chemotaxis protein